MIEAYPQLDFFQPTLTSKSNMAFFSIKHIKRCSDQRFISNSDISIALNPK